MKITFFSFAVFALASAVFAKPVPASNANTIAQAYVPKVKGKGGQLDTELREKMLSGISGLNKTAKANLWAGVKPDVGTLIGKVNNAEIKALPGLIAPLITVSLKGNNAALDKVLAAANLAIIKDFQARGSALNAQLIKEIPAKIVALTKNKADAAIVTTSINSIVNIWVTKQLPTFAEHFTSANFPKNLATLLD